MKKILCILMATMLLLSLCSCKSKKEKEREIKQQMIDDAKERLELYDDVQKQQDSVKNLLDQYK